MIKTKLIIKIIAYITMTYAIFSSILAEFVPAIILASFWILTANKYYGKCQKTSDYIKLVIANLK